MTLNQWADVAGFAGSLIILSTFARATLTGKAPDLVFHLGNLVGASLLGISLSINFNLPALLLEIAWAGIALFGLVRLMVKR
jgi:hypothetical protein